MFWPLSMAIRPSSLLLPSAWGLNSGPVLARLVLYHLNHTSSLLGPHFCTTVSTIRESDGVNGHSSIYIHTKDLPVSELG
jgi:hypothetical protein